MTKTTFLFLLVLLITSCGTPKPEPGPSPSPNPTPIPPPVLPGTFTIQVMGKTVKGKLKPGAKVTAEQAKAVLEMKLKNVK